MNKSQKKERNKERKKEGKKEKERKKKEEERTNERKKGLGLRLAVDPILLGTSCATNIIDT